MKGLVDETEAKKGADGKRCWKGKRYAGTENGKDKCIPVKNEAANPAQQAAIAVNMKKKGQKPKNVDEAKAKPYVKPFMQDGKQVGWKSSDGYHVKYWQMFAKDSAIKHAKLNPDEVQEDYTGQFMEDELDEACWKGYHKEGNKKMFGKTYPNCVKNTNEEEQLDEKCWDSHKQVGMKNKGGKQVPNCVPKESAIMKGLKR